MLHALGKSTTESDITEGFIDFAAKYRISLVRYRNVHFVYTSPKCSPMGGGLYSNAESAEKVCKPTSLCFILSIIYFQFQFLLLICVYSMAYRT